ncbi:MAG: SEC-C domain-containing protein [Clostridia bacterium]|nr:SEC-C domain-containing protein [Clostridia bacterium]
MPKIKKSAKKYNLNRTPCGSGKKYKNCCGKNA